MSNQPVSTMQFSALNCIRSKSVLMIHALRSQAYAISWFVAIWILFKSNPPSPPKKSKKISNQILRPRQPLNMNPHKRRHSRWKLSLELKGKWATTHVWKWPVVKYKHIKIKPRICLLFILCLTWTVNANSLKQNITVIKEICSS